MNTLTKQSVRILLAKGSVGLFSLFFLIYFAYVLPKSLFALIALYETSISLSKVIVDLGLSAKIIKEVPSLFASSQSATAVERIIAPCTVARAIFALILSLLFLIIMNFFKANLYTMAPGSDIVTMIGVAALCLLLENLSDILTPIFSVKQYFGADALLEAASVLVGNIFSFLFYLSWGIDFYFHGILLALAMIFILRMYYIRDILFKFTKARVKLADIFSIFIDYFPFYLRKFFRIGFTQGEHLIVAWLLPINQLANFSLAKKTSNILKTYIEAFGNPMMIKLSSTGDLNIRRRYVRTFLLFTIPPPVLLMAISPWIMAWVGGEKYAPHWMILAVLSGSYVLFALKSLHTSVVAMLGKNWESFWATAIAGTGGLVSTFILILWIGEYGMAWGQVITFLLFYLVSRRLSKKYLTQHPY